EYLISPLIPKKGQTKRNPKILSFKGYWGFLPKIG
ncbi:unnamed protein product, partial [marine sediment metagenome]